MTGQDRGVIAASRLARHEHRAVTLPLSQMQPHPARRAGSMHQGQGAARTCTKWLGASRCVAVWASMRSQLMLATSPLLRWPRSVRKSGPRPSVEPQDSESALMPNERSMILCAEAALGFELACVCNEGL